MHAKHNYRLENEVK